MKLALARAAWVISDERAASPLLWEQLGCTFSRRLCALGLVRLADVYGGTGDGAAESAGDEPGGEGGGDSRGDEGAVGGGRSVNLVPLLLTGVRLHPPGRTDKNLCRCFGAPVRRVFPAITDHRCAHSHQKRQHTLWPRCTLPAEDLYLSNSVFPLQLCGRSAISRTILPPIRGSPSLEVACARAPLYTQV